MTTTSDLNYTISYIRDFISFSLGGKKKVILVHFGNVYTRFTNHDCVLPATFKDTNIKSTLSKLLYWMLLLFFNAILLPKRFNDSMRLFCLSIPFWTLHIVCILEAIYYVFSSKNIPLYWDNVYISQYLRFWGPFHSDVFFRKTYLEVKRQVFFFWLPSSFFPPKSLFIIKKPAETLLLDPTYWNQILLVPSTSRLMLESNLYIIKLEITKWNLTELLGKESYDIKLSFL